MKKSTNKKSTNKNSISKKMEGESLESIKKLANEISIWILKEHIKETPLQNYYNKEKIDHIILKIVEAIINTMIGIELKLKSKLKLNFEFKSESKSECIDKIFYYKSYGSIISSLFNQEMNRELTEIHEIMFLFFILNGNEKMEDFNLKLLRIQ